jgi:recombination protein RecA
MANKEINDLIKSINTQFKANVVNLGKDVVDKLTIKFIPTTSMKLNKILGGGVARGRIAEFFGPTGSGKTTACYEIVGKDMKDDPNSYWGWYETEHSYDQEQAEKFGVDINRLIFWEMDDNGAESGLDILEAVIRKGGGNVKGIIVNSVAGLTPKKELDTAMDKQDMGTQAKMMSKLMRKITAIAGKNDIAVIFINQVRDKISLFGGTTTTGGRALSFFATQRIEFRKTKIESADGVSNEEYIKMNAKIAKNRCAKGNPYVETTLMARYGVGIDRVMELLELAVAQNVIEKKAGGNYRYVTNEGKELKWRGAKALMDFFDDKENKSVFTEVEGKIDQGDIATKQLSDEDMKQLEKYNNDSKAIMQETLSAEEIAAEENNEA